MVGEDEAVGQARQGIAQRLVADGRLGAGTGGGPGEDVRHSEDEVHFLFAKVPRVPAPDAENADGGVLTVDGSLDQAHRLRARPELGDLETSLEGEVVAYDGLLGDEGEADRGGGRVGREQLLSGLAVAVAGGHRHKGRVSRRLENVHEVDVELACERRDGIVNKIGISKAEQGPPAELGEGGLAPDV